VNTEVSRINMNGICCAGRKAKVRVLASTFPIMRLTRQVAATGRALKQACYDFSRRAHLP